MKVCEWTQEYAVDISILDKHHHKLFEILNELFTLMDKGAEDAEIMHVLDELIDYTHYHFEEEEKIMAQMKYPNLIEHQQLHQEFIKAIQDFYDEAKQGMAIFVAVKAANAGLEWLKTHIRTVDHKYAEYAKQHNFTA